MTCPINGPCVCVPQEALDRALALAGEGDDLVQKAHYAQDSIVPKSSELRALCQELSDNLKAKKELLLKARELHRCLESVGNTLVPKHTYDSLSCVHFLSYRPLQASKWCDDGIYLLASQPVDKCQSHEGAESALQELEGFLANAGQNRLSDLNSIWADYEAVLDQHLRVPLAFRN